MKTTSFWTDDFPRPTGLSSSLPSEADVVVVGAGVTGLAAARRLASAGASVVVLDAGRVGGGASSVSGGMVIYGLKAGQRRVIELVGDRLADELWQASLASIDLVERIVRDDGIDCDYSRAGAAALGFHARDAADLRTQGEWLQATVGFSTEFVDRASIGTVVGGSRFVAALIDGVSAGVHPAKYTYGLAGSSARAGAILVEGAEVTGLHNGGARWVVTTSRGTIGATDVLMATNGYTGTQFKTLRRGIVPIGSYSVVTEPLDAGLAAELIPEGRMLWTHRRFLNYFRMTPDRRLLMGGRANLSPDLDLRRSGEILRETVVDFFPELAGTAVTHSWGGRLGVTFDLLPHIGRIDGVWYALGYGGHGMGIGTYLGHEVAGLLAGELNRSPFAEIEHPHRFYYRKRPWFLPAAAALYRFLDRIGR
jgi:glycine/D-amino acid oxidase-like deaminating enzyme